MFTGDALTTPASVKTDGPALIAIYWKTGDAAMEPCVMRVRFVSTINARHAIKNGRRLIAADITPMAPVAQGHVHHPNVSKPKSKRLADVARKEKQLIAAVICLMEHAEISCACPVHVHRPGLIRSAPAALTVKNRIAPPITQTVHVRPSDVHRICVHPSAWILSDDAVCRKKHLIVLPIIPTAHVGKFCVQTLIARPCASTALCLVARYPRPKPIATGIMPMVPAPILPAVPKRVNRTKKVCAARVVCRMKHPIVRIMIRPARVWPSDAEKAYVRNSKLKPKASVVPRVKRLIAVRIMPAALAQAQRAASFPIAQKLKSIRWVLAAHLRQNPFVPARMPTGHAVSFIAPPFPSALTCPLTIHKFAVLKEERRFVEATTPTARVHNMRVKIILVRRKRSGYSARVVKPDKRLFAAHTARTGRAKVSPVKQPLVMRSASTPSQRVV